MNSADSSAVTPAMTPAMRPVSSTTLATAVSSKGPIGSLGGAWMTSEAEEQATIDAGLVDWQLYFLARHGVLGAVDADVVTAAAYVFPPDHVRANWEAALSKHTPNEAVELYLPLMYAWAHEHLDDFADGPRLSELAEHIIGGASVEGLPLFAGWRAVPLPTDPVAALGQRLNVLREHRGACHGVALAALGMSPLMAILTNEGGADNAADYGWQPPFPEVEASDRKLRHEVEELTDAVVARAYGVLSDGEQSEFVDLLHRAYKKAFDQG